MGTKKWEPKELVDAAAKAEGVKSATAKLAARLALTTIREKSGNFGDILATAKILDRATQKMAGVEKFFADKGKRFIDAPPMEELDDVEPEEGEDSADGDFVERFTECLLEDPKATLTAMAKHWPESADFANGMLRELEC